MGCRYKDECPSYSGWCTGPKQDFSKCVQFLISAYENEKKRHTGLRKCQVNLGGDLKTDGYFIMWEQYSRPQAASTWPGGGRPAGIYSQVYGIVETDKGVMRIDPEDIIFYDKEGGDRN